MRSEAAFCFQTGSCRIIQNGTACKCRNPRCAGCSRKDEMQVMIHLDQGGRYFYLKEWFDCSFEAGLEDFDLIGLSYYPFWHGTFTDLKETMTKLIWDYKKPIMVVETAHAWRKSVHGFIDEQQEKLRDFRRRLSDRSRCWIWLPMSLLQCRTKWVRASITGNRSVFRRTARAAGRKTWVCWMRREPSWMVFFLSYLHGMMPARKTGQDLRAGANDRSKR